MSNERDDEYVEAVADLQSALEEAATGCRYRTGST